MYSGYQSFVRRVFANFFPVYMDSSFSFSYSIQKEVLNFYDTFILTIFFLLWFMLFVFYFRILCLIQGRRDFFLCVFLEALQCVSFIFNSVIPPFQVSFCIYCQVLVEIPFLKNMDIQFYQHHLLKTLLSSLYCLGIFVENLLTINVRTVNSLPLTCCLSFQQYHSLDYSGFVVSLEIRQCEFSNFIFFFKIVLASVISWPFHIHL